MEASSTFSMHLVYFSCQDYYALTCALSKILC